MHDFAELFDALDRSTASQDKLNVLVDYFSSAAPEDAAWAVMLLSGGKPRQAVPTGVLRATACRLAGIDDWLFDACYQAVGDLAETIAYVLPQRESTWAADGNSLAQWMENRLLPLRGLAPEEQSQRLALLWQQLDARSRFVMVKLVGGGFRVGVSKLTVQRALAQLTGLDSKLLAQRLVGWTDAKQTPSAQRWQALVAPVSEGVADNGQPYPFFLAHPLAADVTTLGPPQDWLAEWKYDGIRAQLVKRQGQVWIWSRGEELVSDRFPEILAQAATLPNGTVLDGELLVWLPGQDRPAPFQQLQTRINRKLVGKKLLAEAPVVFVAYDLLENAGADQRETPQMQRRQQLERTFEAWTAAGTLPALRLSPLVQAADWAGLALLREQSRARGVEGLMLKHHQARYGTGRTKADGVWWKWKIDPLTVDAVLIYAQAGHGRRASLYTDYTFALWNRPPDSADEAQAVIEAIARREPAQPGALQLLPFAKAYSGLSDAEFKVVDREIRAHTLEKFGPVRSVRPTLVFELGFEGVQRSARHKSGLAVRFPRMLRPRPDKAVWQADALPTLLALAGEG